jgi:ABC-type Mn2+/Zn2+ transport system permease subunit
VEFLLEPFANSIGQRALIALLLLALVCGPLGVWVLLYRHGYAAESVSHGLLPGLVIAALAGLPLVLGAAGGALIAAALIALALRDERLGSDGAVAVVVTSLFGAGALLALTPQTPPRLSELLFGDPLAVDAGTLMLLAALAAGGIAALAAGHRRLALAGFDRSTAALLGGRPSRVELALLGLLALVVCVAVQVLGNLLAIALIVGPGAAALRLSRRLVPALLAGVGLACLAGFAGMIASHHLGLAAGASVALAAIAPLVLTLALPRRAVALAQPA